jgi:hypothetical protein
MLSEKLGIRNQRELIRYLARAIMEVELGPYFHPRHCVPSENDALAFLDYWGLDETLRILETQDREALAQAIDEAWKAGAWEGYEEDMEY